MAEWISRLSWSRQWCRNPWADAVANAYGFDLWRRYADWAVELRFLEPRAAGFSTIVHASNGAEKSFRSPRRRKRGLRIGKRRSRGRHPRRSADVRQPFPKPPSARKVNHRRRTDDWLVRASQGFRKDLEKYVQVTKRIESGNRSIPLLSLKKRVKLRCIAKWGRLHKHACECGFPPKLAFDTSFWGYLSKEFPREGRTQRTDLHYLMFARNPFASFISPEEQLSLGIVDPPAAPLVREPSRNQTRGGGRFNRRPGTNSACRACGYFGPPGHHCRPVARALPRKKGGRP